MLPNRFRRGVADHPAASFVVLTYALTWTIWGGGYFLLPTTAPFLPVVFLGAFGPVIGAVLVTRILEGHLRSWLRINLTWRVPVRWYLAALVVPIVTYGVTALILLGLGASFHVEKLGRGVLIFLGGLPLATFLSGGNEELGWRGFLLPHLQQRYDALTASLIVGTVWAGWHLPVYVLPLGLTNGPFVLFVPFVLLFSIVFTWLYNSTEGSVLAVMVLHGSMNSATALFVGTLGLEGLSSTVLWGSRSIGILIVATVVLTVYGRKTAARTDSKTLPSSNLRNHDP